MQSTIALANDVQQKGKVVVTPKIYVWRGVNIDDVTIHPSRGSRINPTLKQDSTNRGVPLHVLGA